MPIHREFPGLSGSVHDPVRSITQSVVLTAESSDPVSLVARRMRLFNCGALLINMIDGPIRILSERDILRAVADAHQDQPVGALATREPQSIDADENIGAAAALMLVSGVRHLVVNDGDQTGIVSIRDVVGPLLKSATGEGNYIST